MILSERGEVHVTTGLLQSPLVFLIVNIAKPLEEQEREDELLIVARVDGAAQERGRAPQVGLKLLLGDTAAHVSRPSFRNNPLSRSSAA